jgi:WD40 repeat protein
MRVMILLFVCAVPWFASAEDTLAQAAQPVIRADTVLQDAGMGWPVYLCFSPDQKELARLYAFGHVLSDTSSWQKGRFFNVGIRMMAYSPDGKTIATAEGTDGVRIWNAADRGTRLQAPPTTPSERYLLDKPARVLLRPAESRGQRVFWAAFSADGSRLLTADATGHVKIWKTNSWTLEADIAKTAAAVRCATFNPDGKSIVFGDEEGVLYVWDLEQKKAKNESRTPLGAISFLTFSLDGTRLVTGHASGSGNSVMIWNTKDWAAQIERGYQSAAFSKDGTLLALGGTDIRLFSPSSLKSLRTITLPELSPREASARPVAEGGDRKIPVVIQSLAWRPDGRQLAAGCLDGTVRLVPIK